MSDSQVLLEKIAAVRDRLAKAQARRPQSIERDSGGPPLLSALVAAVPALEEIRDLRETVSRTARHGERTWYVYDASGQRVRKVTELANNGGIKDERIYLGGLEVLRTYQGAATARDLKLDALEGVRVLDLSSGRAGRVAAMFLADFGADVVREPGDVSVPWDRGKRIDPDADARDADVVVLSGTGFALARELSAADPSRAGPDRTALNRGCSGR